MFKNIIIPLDPFSLVVDPVADYLASLLCYRERSLRVEREESRLLVQWCAAKLLQDRYLIEVVNLHMTEVNEKAFAYIKRHCAGMEREFYNCLIPTLTSDLMPFEVRVHYVPNTLYVMQVTP